RIVQPIERPGGRLALRICRQDGGTRCTRLLHTLEIAERHHCPTSLVPRRPLAATGRTPHSSQSGYWLSYVQSLQREGPRSRRLEGRAQGQGWDPAARGTLRRSVSRLDPSRFKSFRSPADDSGRSSAQNLRAASPLGGTFT